MTAEIIEKAAEEYALLIVNQYDRDSSEISRGDLRYDCRNAFLNGAMFGLSHQWTDAEEETPPCDIHVLVFVPKREYAPEQYAVGYWDGEDWYTADGEFIRPARWMHIPKHINDR